MPLHQRPNHSQLRRRLSTGVRWVAQRFLLSRVGAAVDEHVGNVGGKRRDRAGALASWHVVAPAKRIARKFARLNLWAGVRRGNVDLSNATSGLVDGERHVHRCVRLAGSATPGQRLGAKHVHDATCDGPDISKVSVVKHETHTTPGHIKRRTTLAL